MKTQIRLLEKNVDKVLEEFLKILADEQLLYTKTRNAHWNITGSDFYFKHKLFEVQCAEIETIINSIAERIRIIDQFAPSTLKVFSELKGLSEIKKEKNDGAGLVKELATDHETIITKLRDPIPEFGEKYNEAGLCDFIIGLIAEHEKMAYFLRAHL